MFAYKHTPTEDDMKIFFMALPLMAALAACSNMDSWNNRDHGPVSSDQMQQKRAQ